MHAGSHINRLKSPRALASALVFRYKACGTEECRKVITSVANRKFAKLTGAFSVLSAAYQSFSIANARLSKGKPIISLQAQILLKVDLTDISSP